MKNKFIPPECVGKQCLDSTKLSATKRLAWLGLVYPKMRLADSLACIWTRFLLYGDVISNLVTPGTVSDRDVHMWRHYVKTLTSVWRIFVTDFKLLRWRLEAFLAWGTLVQEPWETACVNGTFALGVQQSVQSYSDVTVLLALHGAGPIFALVDEIGRVSCSQTSHVSTWIAVMVVPGYTVELENGTRICVVERRLFGGGSIMVWGGITGNARTPLVVINGNLTGARYRDEILQAHVVPFVRQHAVTLQHDNARPHVARVVTDFLTQQNVNVLPWPAVSPDLSPIEHA